MNITLKKNDKPNLPLPTMICDNGLHDKLDKYELTKFINKHSANLLCGKAGSGKTSLLFSFFKSPKLLRKVFHNVFLFQPSASASSIKDNIFDKIPDDQRYDELTYDTLDEVMELCKTEDKKYNNCIIIDDMTAYLKDGEVEKLLKELIFNRRHYRTSIYFLVQSYISVPLQIRKAFNNLWIFKVSKNELKTIFDEVVEQKKEAVADLAKYVYDKPHEYLFINTDTQRLFKGFDEIFISDEKED